ncbi:MAG: GntP family permease [Betaproteobacteria bacterium]
MAFLIVLASLCFLMYVAYRGYSVILFAPIAAMGAVLVTDPTLVAPVFTGLFMDKMVVFVKLYFPIFLLGAIFGKTIELAGFAKSIVAAVIKTVGRERAIFSIVLVCCLLTYGGVSVFVVVFAVYPFAAEMFKAGGIPKRLIPGTIALGSFTITMDAFPGTPQIQNVIPTTFFKTTIYAAPWLGVIGGLLIVGAGLAYLEWMRRRAQAAGEGYGTTNLVNEPEPFDETREKLPNPFIAILPLVMVAVSNYAFTEWIPQFYGTSHQFIPSVIGKAAPVVQPIASVRAIWAVEGALLVGIAMIFLFAFKPVMARFIDGSKSAIAGALLASINTASEYGYGSVIASLTGFLVVAEGLKVIPNPLIHEAITVTTLAGITGSASGGLGIALSAMSSTFIANAQAAGIPLEVMHRVASMASGGMDSLPHNGAVITLLMVTGLTHRQSYKDIFAITILKTIGVFVVIGIYYATGLV